MFRLGGHLATSVTAIFRAQAAAKSHSGAVTSADNDDLLLPVFTVNSTFDAFTGAATAAA